MFLREGATIDEKVDFLMQRLDSLDDRIHDLHEKIDGDIEELQNRLADQVWGGVVCGEDRRFGCQAGVVVRVRAGPRSHVLSWADR